MSHLAIYAVDLGSQNTRAGIYLDGETTQVAKVDTPLTRIGDDIVLLDCIHKLVDEMATQAPPMRALAVSFSGFLGLRKSSGARRYGTLRDHEILVNAPHINGLMNIPFFQWIRSTGIDVPLHIENDANAALRAHTETPTAIGINMGTGLAGALKRDNEIVHMPKTWSCYQIGHGFNGRLSDPHIRHCRCGSVGCLEAAIGAWALTERFGVSPESASDDIHELMARDVVDLLAPAVSDLIEQSGITEVVLTGGAARGFEKRSDLCKRLTIAVDRLRPNRGNARIVLAERQETSGLHGVSLAALDCGVFAVPIGL